MLVVGVLFLGDGDFSFLLLLVFYIEDKVKWKVEEKNK